MEVHRRGRENRIDRIAGNALQAIALQPVFVLQMSDAGFDRRAAFHPSPECARRSASLPLVDMHSNFAVIFMAAIAHIHVRFTYFAANQVIHLPHLRAERVAIIGIARETLRAHQPSARLVTATLTLLPNS